MKKKQANVSVKLKHCNNNVEKMIRRFMKKTKKEKIVEEVRERKYYTKPSDAKRLKRRRSERARLREERKHQRAQERRNRKK
jgi:ribosomal protein S21